MKFLLLSLLLCGLTAADYNPDKGTKLTAMSVGGQTCILWAVSHNAIWLECNADITGYMFDVEGTPLSVENKEGKTFLIMRQNYQLPYHRQYTIQAKSPTNMMTTVTVEPNRKTPMPQVIPKLPTYAYEVTSGKITVLNANTIFVPRFNYNGKGPDAFFWAGKGKPNGDGFIIPDEKGSKEVLGRYDSKDILLTLPDGKTVHDIDYFSVWCRAYAHDFGSVMLPEQLMVPPAFYKPEIMDYSELILKTIGTDDSGEDVSDNDISASGVSEKRDKDNEIENAGSVLSNSYIYLLAMIQLWIVYA